MKEKVRIKVDDEEIVGTLFYPNEDKQHKAAILLYGKNGVKERFYPLAETLLKKNYASVCFDFRGRGESDTGQVPAIIGRVKDAKAVLKYFSKLPFVDPENITLISTSMGSYVATSICNKLKGVSKIVLVAPMIYSKNYETKPYTSETQDAIEELRETNVLRNSRPIEEIRKYKEDVIVATVSGDHIIPDFIVDAYYNNALRAKSRKKLEIIFKEHGILASEEGQQKFTKFINDMV